MGIKLKFVGFKLVRTYAKTLYIAHENFDGLHSFSRALAELCVSNHLTIFIQKTNSNSSQITFILIEEYFNLSVRYFDNNPCLT